jgi:ferric-dicitrate binding protein FerR (iron transport regulator)
MQIPEHIIDLINKYQAGTISEKELKNLNDWYHSFEDTQVNLTESNLSEEEIRNRIKFRLDETIGATQIPGRSIGNRNWIMAASAIGLLLLGAASFYFFSGSPDPAKPAISKTVSPAQSDIAPGGDKAVLILANGSSVVLDSTANGTINTQGNIRVLKLNTGQLAYNVEGNTALNAEMVYNTIKTPRGGQYQVTLSDGTMVWLNAASSLRFPISFSDKNRTVEITGEAYFEVASDKKKPFIVRANNSETEVLGTHFNINAYTDESSIRTTLLEGKVKVRVAGAYSKEELFLKPGQQSVINKNAIIRINRNADLEETMAWKNGRFQFNSTDLQAILRQIARWYDVEVVYQDSVDLQFTGQLPRNEYASAVFEKLALTGEVKFKIEGKKVFVRATSK